ncbi:LysR substrate-binding domain-containing protein [Sagittula sp. S175]|uniref:LysR substrate-binding domain-containing protein n=1 Tax=Sagittula sp. S175 TaxID=3415129 RepID=UPI003C7B75BE
MLSARLRMRHFRTFLALWEHGSLTAAAKAMNTAQPALSRSLREMEAEIGVPLFERTSRGMTPTPEGAVLHRHLTAGMAQIESGVAQASGARQAETLALGMLPNAARLLVPAALKRFKRDFPDVTVSIYWASVPELIDLLRRGQVDFLASRLVSIEQLAGVLFEHLYDEPLIFAARAGHPLAAAEQVSLAEIDAYTVVVPLSGTIIRTELDRFLFARGAQIFRNRVETVSFEFARAYMAMEDAVLFLPRGSILTELQSGAAVQLALPVDDLTGSVGLSYIADRPLSEAARRLADHLRAVAAEIRQP